MPPVSPYSYAASMALILWGFTDVHRSRPGPSDHACRHHLARPHRRVPVVATRPDSVRNGPVTRFVRNDQYDVLFPWLTLPELVHRRWAPKSRSTIDAGSHAEAAGLRIHGIATGGSLCARVTLSLL